MKKILALLFLILAYSGGAFAADLAWNYPDQWDEIDGYTVHYTDGDEDYTMTVNRDELLINEGAVVLPGMEDRLNLQYGVEYTLHLTAFNSAGESGPSNSVTHSRTGYTPPGDSAPTVIDVPGRPLTIIINIGGQ